MGIICILDENTSNQIAAGEVIERPASIVKELAENAIDAGADYINVEIKRGGIEYIKITDNGCGFEKDDMVIAFERHATSKLQHASQLSDITTMGFRGEALASIASVADVEVYSKSKNAAENENGYYVHFRGGKLIDEGERSCRYGTTIIVRELFYNTPARFKFLKRDSAEAGSVNDIIIRLALSNPHISFRLSGAFAGKNEVFHTPGNNDLKSVIYTIYGREYAANLMPIRYKDDIYELSGFIGNAAIAKSNRSYQSIMINGRYIKCNIISAAIDNACKTFFMVKKFPFLVLNIKAPTSVFDVNVHPAKTEVRFADEKKIASAVYYAVQDALSNEGRIATQTIKDIGGRSVGIVADAESKSYNEPAGTYDVGKTNVFKKTEVSVANNGVKPIVHEVPNSVVRPSVDVSVKPRVESLFEKKWNQPASQHLIRSEVEKSTSAEKESITLNTDLNLVIKPIEPVVADDETTASIFAKEEPATGESQIEFLKTAYYVGQIFDTYLIYEHGGKAYLLDQHAAHERINFERIKKEYETNSVISQVLMVPVVVDFAPNDYSDFCEEEELFKKLGFDFEQFGGTSVVFRAIPTSLDLAKVTDAVFELIENLKTSRGNKALFDERALYTIACKMSVKANSKLALDEVKQLINELALTENPLTCPHGRPTVLSSDKNEFAKLFKRIT